MSKSAKHSVAVKKHELEIKLRPEREYTLLVFLQNRQ